MKNYPIREILRNFFSVVAGVFVAGVFLFFVGPSRDFAISNSSYKHPDPISHAIWKELFFKTHAWQEIYVLIISFFIGSLVTSLISGRQNLLHALLVPPILLCFYHSLLGPEITMLALPCWMFIALLAWKLGEWIKFKWKRKAAT